MKPVQQTRLGRPDGNCFEAALASILEMPIEAIPEFGKEDDWYDRFIAFMAQFGIEAVDTEPNGGWHPVGYYLIHGESPRGIRHTVVGYNGEMIHDPHPENMGLVQATAITIFMDTMEQPGRLSPLQQEG